MSNLLKTPNTRQAIRPFSTRVEDSADKAVTAAEAKAYAKIDYATEDDIVDMLINGAQQAFETFTGRLIFQREVVTKFDLTEYESLLYLPWLPAVSITTVKDSGGSDVDHSQYGYRLALNGSGVITVTYQAGITTGAVPDDLKVGLLKWITSNYNDREDSVLESVYEMPNSSRKHWMRYKKARV